MKVTVLCSSDSHPVYPYLIGWKKQHGDSDVRIINSVSEIRGSGDILFLISCSEIVGKNIRDWFRYTLVLHASDLPKGRGWSPHIWDIVNGAEQITLSLLDAEDSVDTGNIWKKTVIPLSGDELYNEINHKLFQAELDLMSWACKRIDEENSIVQLSDDKASYYRKRTPDDSRLNVDQTIRAQFNLMRVCDPERFPAFFEMNGVVYKVKLEKMPND